MTVKIIEKIKYANKYYVKVQNDIDNTITELSSIEELTDTEWENLYEQTKQTETEFDLEAEDGTAV